MEILGYPLRKFPTWKTALQAPGYLTSSRNQNLHSSFPSMTLAEHYYVTGRWNRKNCLFILIWVVYAMFTLTSFIKLLFLKLFMFLISNFDSNRSSGPEMKDTFKIAKGNSYTLYSTSESYGTSEGFKSSLLMQQFVKLVRNKVPVPELVQQFREGRLYFSLFLCYAYESGFCLYCFEY